MRGASSGNVSGKQDGRRSTRKVAMSVGSFQEPVVVAVSMEKTISILYKNFKTMFVENTTGKETVLVPLVLPWYSKNLPTRTTNEIVNPNHPSEFGDVLPISNKPLWCRLPKIKRLVLKIPPSHSCLVVSSEEEEDNYTWKPLWDSLKKKGWTAIGAAKYNILHDWYYVRPRCSVDTGTMGVDYFHDPTDVIDFIRAQEERNDDFGTFRKRKEAIRTLSSPRKRSRKSRIQEEFANAASTTASTSTTIKSTVVAATRTKKKQPMKKWWFHDEALPSFRQVWNILHTKLDFLYSGGCYKLPSGKETFTCDYDMRCHLLQHGIPNIHRLLDPDDVTLLTRWVTFAHVPVKDTNSIVKLENMQELTTEQALAFLRKIQLCANIRDDVVPFVVETVKHLRRCKRYETIFALRPPSLHPFKDVVREETSLKLL